MYGFTIYEPLISTPGLQGSVGCHGLLSGRVATTWKLDFLDCLKLMEDGVSLH